MKKSTLIKQKNIIFLIYKEIQKGSGAKVIYDFAPSHLNFVFFFYQCRYSVFIYLYTLFCILLS
jgi:hypothetical protein